MGADQRRFRRKMVSVRFSARDGSGAGQLWFTSADVSAGGAFLLSELLLEPGEALTVEFALQGAAVIQAQGRVAWVRRFPSAGEPAGMGVEFVGLNESQREALTTFVAS
jgi:uncharacterized protein (TIGR02266 family)